MAGFNSRQGLEVTCRLRETGPVIHIYSPPVRAHRLISACSCMYLIFRPRAVIAVGDGGFGEPGWCRRGLPRLRVLVLLVSCVCVCVIIYYPAAYRPDWIMAAVSFLFA